MPNTRTAETSGGWTWPLSYSSERACPSLEEMNTDERGHFESLAVDFLWRWTNRKFGTKDVTVRPVSTLMPRMTHRMDRFWGFGPYSVGSSGPLWIKTARSSLRPSQLGAGSIHLPMAIEVLEVTLDGEELPPSEYTLIDGNLVRRDGEPWPLDQDPLLPDTEEDTFAVTYRSGSSVPTGGKIAAGTLACEFAMAAQGDPECGLPQRVQTFTRQGVSVATLDEFDDLKEGHTGIWLIDSWIASITQTPSRPSVLSPDYRRRPQRHPHQTTVRAGGEG